MTTVVSGSGWSGLRIRRLASRFWRRSGSASPRALEQGAVVGRAKEVVGLEKPGAVPADGHAGRQQRLYLGGQVQRAAVGRVIEGLDAEAIPCGEERVVGAVPEGEGKLAAQLAQAGRAVVFIEVKGDLAVGAGAEAVAPALEVALRPRASSSKRSSPWTAFWTTIWTNLTRLAARPTYCYPAHVG
jgi:hypothetical protein